MRQDVRPQEYLIVLVATIGLLIDLVLSVSVSAEPLIEGQVRLESGEPIADAQVRLFDMSDLRQGAVARAQTDDTGYFAVPLAALRGSALPKGFVLGPNYPNPFNPATIIPYQLAASSQVQLEVFNLLGQRIATLIDGARPAGFHTATWHATDRAGRAVGAGVYIYRMTVGVESQMGRMVLIDGQAGVSAGGIASDWLGVSSGGPAEEQVYGLIVSGEGLVPLVDSAFRVKAGMAPVEWVVSAGRYSARKATDDDCALCDLFDAFGDAEDEETPEEEGENLIVSDADRVTIPDADLRMVIEKALGKASGATITVADIAKINDLEALNMGIKDLTGLEFAANLTTLTLGNYIEDVSPLAGLTNLTALYLVGNITDISPLAGLTKLKELTLDHNDIADISPLAGLTNLTRLWLGATTSRISRHLRA